MERLEFGEFTRYSAIEASIHVARYLTAKDLCLGQDVLDVACGEGYGSWLMSHWGAKSVCSSDLSNEAVDKANMHFSSESVRFVSGFGENLAEVVKGKQYGLIVSLETIEHVEDPELFLENIKAVAAPDATIVLSAPNDYWYYDLGGHNEFHKRRFTFEEFRGLTERVLGKAKSWSLGTLGIGFSVCKQDGSLKSGNAGTPQDLMLQLQNIGAAVYVPSQLESDPTAAEVAFYVGVWGSGSISETIFAGYPVSMNLGRQALFPRDGIWAIKPDPSRPAADTLISTALMHKVKEAQARELSLSNQIDSLKTESASLSEKLRFSEHKLTEMQSKEAGLVNQIGSLKDELAAVSDRLYFSEIEVERLGMSRRAAQAEVKAAWRAIWRHEAALANVPWNVVRAWWSVRKVIPVPVLRVIKRVLDALHRSHAN